MTIVFYPILTMLLLYSHMPYHNDTIINRRNDKDRRSNKRRRKTSLTKYIPLTLLQGFERVVQDLRVRGSWRSNITAIFWPPNLWPSTLSLSRSSDAQPEAQRPLCWVMAFFTASYQHLLRTSTHQGPKAPSGWCDFPDHISSITPSDLQLNCLQLNWSSDSTGSSNSTELYNRSTPTRSLKSNV